ncbi:peptidase C39 family protein [Ectopseudomonas mendocina]|uniref:Peptidase C39 family protein n=1 Tax=Ectopseudomonas mendocina TaxID=300 RepID=A0ABZ2RDF7_ECTME
MAGWLSVAKVIPVGLLLVLSVACSSGPQLKPETGSLPERVELVDVPFFYLNDPSGGDSALAALLNHHSVLTTPGVVKQRLSDLAGGQEPRKALAVVAGSYDQVVYPLATSLDALIQQVAGGFPVLVQLDKTFSGPGGEFALLVGYDQRERTVVLRRGNVRRLHMRLSDFDEAWAEAGRWAVVILPANNLPAQADRETWMSALRELQMQGRDLAVQRGVSAARAHWPDFRL